MYIVELPKSEEILLGVQISFRHLTKVGVTSKFWLKLTDIKRHCRKLLDICQKHNLEIIVNLRKCRVLSQIFPSFAGTFDLLFQFEEI